MVSPRLKCFTVATSAIFRRSSGESRLNIGVVLNSSSVPGMGASVARDMIAVICVRPVCRYPSIWSETMTAIQDMTIREIVANDFRAAEVFQRHGIDFCCKGNRSIEEACRSLDVTAEEILREVGEGDGDARQQGVPDSIRGIWGRWFHISRETITHSCDGRPRCCSRTPRRSQRSTVTLTLSFERWPTFLPRSPLK